MTFELSNFLWVVVALAVFGWCLSRLGLVPAAFLGAFLASMAERQIGWLGRVLIAAGVAVVSALIFKLGLGMILPLWWWEG